MNDPDLSKESRDSYSNVTEKAINMTESIKHAIVLLQVKLKNKLVLRSFSHSVLRVEPLCPIILNFFTENFEGYPSYKLFKINLIIIVIRTKYINFTQYCK